jgi:hypothetical protein
MQEQRTVGSAKESKDERIRKRQVILGTTSRQGVVELEAAQPRIGEGALDLKRACGGQLGVGTGLRREPDLRTRSSSEQHGNPKGYSVLHLRYISIKSMIHRSRGTGSQAPVEKPNAVSPIAQR